MAAARTAGLMCADSAAPARIRFASRLEHGVIAMIIPTAHGMAGSATSGFRTGWTGSVAEGEGVAPDSERCSAYVDIVKTIPSDGGSRCCDEQHESHVHRAGGWLTRA